MPKFIEIETLDLNTYEVRPNKCIINLDTIISFYIHKDATEKTKNTVLSMYYDTNDFSLVFAAQIDYLLTKAGVLFKYEEEQAK